MNTERIAHLDAIMNTLQHRWGQDALKRLTTDVVETAAPIATGFAPLDALLQGGLPRQQMTEISGTPTSGMTTLTLQMLAQDARGIGVYVDLPATFDPEYAVLCGIQPERLLVVQPERPEDLSVILRDLLLGLGAGLVVVNNTQMPAHRPSYDVLSHPHLRQLGAHLKKTSCALLFLQSHPGEVSRHAAVRLEMSRTRWLVERGDVVGYQSEVRLTRFRSAPSHGAVCLNLRIDGKRL